MNTKDLLLRRRMMMEGRSPLPPPEYKSMPLTFDILSDGDIIWTDWREEKQTIEYSKNDGAWTSISASEEEGTAIIAVVAGDELRLRGTAWPNDEYGSTQFGSTCQFSIKGNPASLKYGDVLTGNEELAEECFGNLFYNCSGLISAQHLALPASTLAYYCYGGMFNYCANLVTAPELPATTLADSCYSDMFLGCASLTSAPELPATTLADYCYASMFSGCTSLTTAPVLPATTLAKNCYRAMFEYCNSLVTAPILPATTLANNCYMLMFYSCSLTNAPQLPATTLASGCYYSMFGDCSSLTVAPELPATTLADGCYQGMFNGCINLQVAPVLPAETLCDYCYQEMFGNCGLINEIKCYAINNIDDQGWPVGTLYWLDGVAETGTFTKAASAVWPEFPNEGDGIPSGWTVVEV